MTEEFKDVSENINYLLSEYAKIDDEFNKENKKKKRVIIDKLYDIVKELDRKFKKVSNNVKPFKNTTEAELIEYLKLSVEDEIDSLYQFWNNEDTRENEYGYMEIRSIDETSKPNTASITLIAYSYIYDDYHTEIKITVEKDMEKAIKDYSIYREERHIPNSEMEEMRRKEAERRKAIDERMTWF